MEVMINLESYRVFFKIKTKECSYNSSNSISEFLGLDVKEYNDRLLKAVKKFKINNFNAYTYVCNDLVFTCKMSKATSKNAIEAFKKRICERIDSSWTKSMIYYLLF